MAPTSISPRPPYLTSALEAVEPVIASLEDQRKQAAIQMELALWDDCRTLDSTLSFGLLYPEG